MGDAVAHPGGASGKSRLKVLARPQVIAAFVVAGGGMAAAAITAVASSHSSSTPTSVATPSPSPTPSTNQLTVADAFIGGAWAVREPTLTVLSPRQSPPAGAVRWIKSGTVEQIVCAQRGAKYSVKNDNEQQTWQWWARLSGSPKTYVPMAQFQQTTLDGAQGFRICK